MPETPSPAAAPTLATPKPISYTGRRFAQSFCDFFAVGPVLRPPAYVRNKRGGATATFSIKIGGDRDLDLLMAGRDIPELQYRLRDAQPGVIIHVSGQINPPRINHRETSQFYAERVVAMGTSGKTTVRPQPTVEPQAAAAD